ncbi:hypothetical protein ACJ72_08527 [Emergomyces africanus]|uniref:Uncharacterized protein n=1 Tax=Emergomyces africanus TaxID=1955775 RepID=A0A1B7NKM9_9EURO|nr:hypothetical protein ACJ72_08527 [Emergomyces africanus]
MQFTSKLVALMLSFASLTLAAPAENAPEQGKYADDLLACKAGSYRCDGWGERIEVCSGGRWALTAVCANECLYDGRGVPYCI